MATDHDAPDDMPDDALLRRYVLGLATADESERIDELSVTLPDIATRLQSVEYDLIDAYAAGELSTETMAAVRSGYPAAADWRMEIGFADTLRAWQTRVALPTATTAASAPTTASAAASATTATTAPATTAATADVTRGVSAPTPTPAERTWQQPAPSVRSARWVSSESLPRWMLAVAATLALVVLGYLAIDNLSLRRDVNSARAERAALDDRARVLQQQIDQQRTADSETAKELARLRESIAALEQRAAAGGGSSVATAPTVIAAFVLPAAVRGATEVTRIALPPKVDAVRLHVTLETERFATFDALVRDATSNRVVWRGAGFHPIARAVAITVSAGVLQSRTYLLELSGVRPGAAPEPLAPYAFQVVIP